MPRFCRHCGRPGIRRVCRGCSVQPHERTDEEKAAIKRDFDPGGPYHDEQEYLALRRLGMSDNPPNTHRKRRSRKEEK